METGDLVKVGRPGHAAARGRRNQSEQRTEDTVVACCGLQTERHAIDDTPRYGLFGRAWITKRFNTRGGGKTKLSDGGRLQDLASKGSPTGDTRNWDEKLPVISVGQTFKVEWVDLDDVEAPKDDLRYRAFEADAARFARGEGMWYGDGAIYLACNSGGRKEIGQIWMYTPSNAEGESGEAASPGTLELFIDPNDSTLIENADNLTVAPWNELCVCEDRGSRTARIISVTSDGQPFVFAACHLKSELAGATFSPDGSTLFVNAQKSGLTFAVTGPWHA